MNNLTNYLNGQNLDYNKRANTIDVLNGESLTADQTAAIKQSGIDNKCIETFTIHIEFPVA